MAAGGGQADRLRGGRKEGKESIFMFGQADQLGGRKEGKEGKEGEEGEEGEEGKEGKEGKEGREGRGGREAKA